MGEAAFPFLLLVLLAGCAGGSSGSGQAGKKEEQPPDPPDLRALDKETVCKARSARLVLSSRWRRQARIEAGRETVRETDVGVEVTLEGNVVFTLRKLRIEASESLRVTWLGPTHDNILLHARDVELFKQVVLFGHRAENVSAATMANDTVSFFQQ